MQRLGQPTSLIAALPPIEAGAGLIGLMIAMALATLGASGFALRQRARLRRLTAATASESLRRTLAEKAARETEAVYHSLVETLPQSFLRKDLEGRFTFANQRFFNELGHPRDEVVGKTDYDFFPRPLAEKYRADDRWVVETGRVLDIVEQHVTPRGETLHVQVMKTPLHAADGGLIGIQAIFWDVTARIRAEEQLREKNVELEGLARSEHQAHEALKQAQSLLVQNEKLASLGQLVAGVAHEINNPLAFVSNNVAVLERDIRDLLRLIELYRRDDQGAPADPVLTEERTEILERIDLEYCLDNFPRLIERTREGLRRIERIVKELRLFARVDEGEWNEVDLNPGIESSINMVKGYARKKGVQIVMDLGAMPAVRCRAARIHQVILNLLTNAIDACGENGLVTVRTETEADAMGVRVDIDDNGGGIPPEVRDRIFDPFFTTKPLGQGTGLGLSISYGIIQEHNGRIEVQSTVGYGSCFSVHLPIEPSRSPYGGPAAESHPDAGAGRPVVEERVPHPSSPPTPTPADAAPTRSATITPRGPQP
ncbi:ATP-binding protein [Planctomyces sp. SH-PL62]|uniref:PAS domain-containing sensor histidine kinase n=1 Tax=Planctomyces sp. SH-PL62 TaxID=1636152 RepID=UPI00078BE8CB|nr:ATP-binding protein [Planctomyces sp. SH-PL62]AMV39618.1 Sensor protein ZraS [Planctomyces sp. SH-PL62]